MTDHDLIESLNRLADVLEENWPATSRIGEELCREAAQRLYTLTEWRPIASAPGSGQFIVSDGARQMIADGKMLAISRMPGIPKELNGYHWTHWKPLGPLPVKFLPPDPTPL